MKVVVVSGPTASGKTKISIALAKRFNAEIVNFDSLLLYKEITIGTAKPTLHEQSSIPHHMLEVRSISEPMNAADFSAMATPTINEILSRGKIVILVGGSGFYLQALLKGMYDSPTTPLEVRTRSDELYEKEGVTPFLNILKKHDRESYERYHENDHYRIRRAVEHWWAHGTPLFEERLKKNDANKSLSGPTVHDWEILNLYLDLPKEEHLEIITARTDEMIRNGLIEEVKNLLQSGFTGLEKPLQSIGYKETLDYLSGELKSIDQYRERIIISTRQLAKSQRTWFKRDHSKKTFHPLNDEDSLFKLVADFLAE